MVSFRVLGKKQKMKWSQQREWALFFCFSKATVRPQGLSLAGALGTQMCPMSFICEDCYWPISAGH